MIISGNAQRILKILHILAVSFWLGGCLAEFILYYASTTAESGDELFGLLRGSRFVAMLVVVYPGAFGSFFTGLAYSMCTNKGFFKHKWIILKWAGTVCLLLFGLIYLPNWSTQMLEAAQKSGLEALSEPQYILARSNQLTALSVYFFTLVSLTVISVFKPWEVQESIDLLNKKLGVEK